jgi:hypothetical protein
MMPWYPDADKTMELKGPMKVKTGANTPVRRIVVHSVGSAAPERPNQSGDCWSAWVIENATKKVSAHFCVERDGRITQFADTNDVTYGTGWCTAGSIHIENAGNHPLPLTRDQLDYGARLIGWLATVHPDIRLEVEGTGDSDPGDPTKACITCHRFIQQAAKREIKAGRLNAMTITDKTCPGTGIIAQLPELASRALRQKALRAMGLTAEQDPALQQ